MGKRAKDEGSIFQRKDGRWVASITLGYDARGKRQRRTRYAPTEAAALKALRKLNEEAEAGVLDAARSNVGQLLDQWLEAKQHDALKPRTMDLYRYQIEKYLRPKLGRIVLDRLKPLQIQQAVGQILREAGPRTAQGALTTLKGALNRAVEWQLLTKSPAQYIRPPKVPDKEIEILTPDEVRQLLAATAGHRLHALWYVALATGMRNGELRALEWRDVTFGDRPSIRVRATATTDDGQAVIDDRPKTVASRRRIPVGQDAVRVLAAHRELLAAEASTRQGYAPNPLVFPSAAGTLQDPSLIQRSWRTARALADLRPVTLHVLRHTHASLCIRAGMDVRLLADRLGHSDPAFTLRTYAHVFDEHRQTGAMSVEELLGGPILTPALPRPSEAV